MEATLIDGDLVMIDFTSSSPHLNAGFFYIVDVAAGIKTQPMRLKVGDTICCVSDNDAYETGGFVQKVVSKLTQAQLQATRRISLVLK